MVHSLQNPARQVSPGLRIPTLLTRLRQYRMKELSSSHGQVEVGLASKYSGSCLALFTLNRETHK